MALSALKRYRHVPRKRQQRLDAEDPSLSRDADRSDDPRESRGQCKLRSGVEAILGIVTAVLVVAVAYRVAGSGAYTGACNAFCYLVR